MTAEQEELAYQALIQIEDTRPDHVYASRPGIVVAALFRHKKVAFRRVNGVIRMEVWGNYKSGCEIITDLPRAIQNRAAHVINNLPGENRCHAHHVPTPCTDSPTSRSTSGARAAGPSAG